MGKNLSSLHKWTPIDGIPEAMPWEIILVTGTAGGAEVSMRFSSGTLVVCFLDVCAVFAFEEFCDTLLGHKFAMRFCDYPLWKVNPSALLDAFSKFTLSRDQNEYEHYCLGGFDGTIHLLSAGSPKVSWLK